MAFIDDSFKPAFPAFINVHGPVGRTTATTGNKSNDVRAVKSMLLSIYERADDLFPYLKPVPKGTLNPASSVLDATTQNFIQSFQNAIQKKFGRIVPDGRIDRAVGGVSNKAKGTLFTIVHMNILLKQIQDSDNGPPPSTVPQLFILGLGGLIPAGPIP